MRAVTSYTLTGDECDLLADGILTLHPVGARGYRERGAARAEVGLAQTRVQSTFREHVQEDLPWQLSLAGALTSLARTGLRLRVVLTGLSLDEVQTLRQFFLAHHADTMTLLTRSGSPVHQKRLDIITECLAVIRPDAP